MARVLWSLCAVGDPAGAKSAKSAKTGVFVDIPQVAVTVSVGPESTSTLGADPSTRAGNGPDSW